MASMRTAAVAVAISAATVVATAGTWHALGRAPAHFRQGLAAPLAGIHAPALPPVDGELLRLLLPDVPVPVVSQSAASHRHGDGATENCAVTEAASPDGRWLARVIRSAATREIQTALVLAPRRTRTAYGQRVDARHAGRISGDWMEDLGWTPAGRTWRQGTPPVIPAGNEWLTRWTSGPYRAIVRIDRTTGHLVFASLWRSAAH